ncbi:MAG: site-specific integrase [Eubacterium sp.]|nr:site-specific integrase [Eubacterium sp.]
MNKTRVTEVRRDDKGRLLRKGEYQEPNGRYKYSYSDLNGVRHSVYSWRLDVHDRIIKGKKKDISLREKEKQIEVDLFNEVIPEGGRLTVYELAEKYTQTKIGVKPTTRLGYRTVLKYLSKDPMGEKRIDKVKLSDAKLWLIDLQKNGRGYSWLHQVRGVLRPAFRMAVEDDLIRKNPFDFELATVIYNDSVAREAIMEKDEERFLRFVKEDAHFSRYYEGMYILFHTGLRISEFVGLTVRDIDFESMTVNVDHQLIYENGKGLSIQTPKTKSGVRKIPMTEEVADCFRIVIANRPKLKMEPIVDGYARFLYINEWGNPKAHYQWEKYFQHAVEKYNQMNRVPLPKITPHICRHTFCSNMAKRGMNPKTLQYIMGHADISVTMNVYAHIRAEDAGEEMRRIMGEPIAPASEDTLKIRTLGI